MCQFSVFIIIRGTYVLKNTQSDLFGPVNIRNQNDKKINLIRTSHPKTIKEGIANKMAEGTYEFECMRAELLGVEKPNQEEFEKSRAERLQKEQEERLAAEAQV